MIPYVLDWTVVVASNGVRCCISVGPLLEA